MYGVNLVQLSRKNFQSHNNQGLKRGALVKQLNAKLIKGLSSIKLGPFVCETIAYNIASPVTVIFA